MRSGERAGGTASVRAVQLVALAVFIAAVYALVVVGLGRLLGADVPNTALSVLAMSIVALTFGRARIAAEKLAGRLVRGERATPYEVLAGFSERFAASYRPEEVLPRMAELVAAGTGAARVEVWLRVERQLLLAARWPERAGPPPPRIPLDGSNVPPIPDATRTVAVRDRDELLGAIAVTGRAESFHPGGAEGRLLDDVASQAGLVLRNVRLTAELTARLDELSATTAELRSSRRRIVETQDAERRRIERDIHDGAQQHLVALAVKIRMARSFAERDPDRARAMIGEVRTLAGSALDNLRDLTHGIYPPALVERGVAAALRAHVAKAGAGVTVTAEGAGRADPAVEAAAYFASLEAIQNAAKHAHASRVNVHVAHKQGMLTFTVEDDGAGFDPARAVRGSGLQNMEDRLAVVGGWVEIRSSLGGGTAVTGRIPARILEATR